MDDQGGLERGSRVAIVGGGISGTAMALALAQGARAHGLPLDIRLFDGSRETSRGFAPLILTPECRARLAGLGCPVLPEWRTLDLGRIEIISGRRREILPMPGVWVVDDVGGQGGHRLVADALGAVASVQGAGIVHRRVDRIERRPMASPPRTLASPKPGPLLVRSQGAAERFHAVALACGVGTVPGESGFGLHAPPPTLPAAHARLRHCQLSPFGPQLVRLVLAPLPGVDALYLIPCLGSIYAIALGPTASPADLCQAVMVAARDGYVPEGFEVAQLATTRVGCGAGRGLVAEGQLVIGAAAFGHPLQLGISETLASASRAASALLESGPCARALTRRYLREGIPDLLEDAEAGSRALVWLRRAGDGAAAVLARARAHSRWVVPFNGGVLGMPCPTPLELLSAARWAGMARTVRDWIWRPLAPEPTALMVEPDLYYIVDDDPAGREALTHLLESSGATVVAFADELALFCAVARRPPTAILLDVVLQWVDGLRLCEGLKAHPLTRDSRVVVLSGLNRPHVRTRALAAGAEAFVSKPLDPQRLLELLHPCGSPPAADRLAPPQDDGGSPPDRVESSA